MFILNFYKPLINNVFEKIIFLKHHIFNTTNAVINLLEFKIISNLILTRLTEYQMLILKTN